MSKWYELQVIMTSYYFYNLTHLVNESKYAQHLHLHHSSPATQEGGVYLKERVVANYRLPSQPHAYKVQPLK